MYSLLLINKVTAELTYFCMLQNLNLDASVNGIFRPIYTLTSSESTVHLIVDDHKFSVSFKTM